MIPGFDIHGVLPPIRPGEDGTSLLRSPYRVDLLTFCKHFGSSSERRQILGGLLDLRNAIRNAGLVGGYQWLDGSFTEDVERLRGQPPNDIDVVTFVPLGDAANQNALLAAHPNLFRHVECKRTYRVDHYFVNRDQSLTTMATQTVCYWYSMWSHQRGSQRWKGFVSVPMMSNDANATAWLASLGVPGGGP